MGEEVKVIVSDSQNRYYTFERVIEDSTGKWKVYYKVEESQNPLLGTNRYVPGRPKNPYKVMKRIGIREFDGAIADFTSITVPGQKIECVNMENGTDTFTLET